MLRKHFGATYLGQAKQGEWTKVEFLIDQIIHRSNLEPTPKGCIPDRPPEGGNVSPILDSVYREFDLL